MASGDQKMVIYFHLGEVTYAISNARAFRLFDILLRENKIGKDFLATNPKFANDMELAKSLAIKGVMTKAEIDGLLFHRSRQS